MPDYQLSLAIGKEGQNARLAAKLTGWRIDIRSDTAVPEGEAGRVGAGTGSRGGASSADRPRGQPRPGRVAGARAAARPAAGAPLAAVDRSRR